MHTTPLQCSDDYNGRCQCGEVSKGFTTYTFWLRDIERCFTVYRPVERALEVLPVVLTSQCYGKDRLGAIGMMNGRTPQNSAAKQYGFSRIGL